MSPEMVVRLAAAFILVGTATGLVCDAAGLDAVALAGYGVAVAGTVTGGVHILLSLLVGD